MQCVDRGGCGVQQVSAAGLVQQAAVISRIGQDVPNPGEMSIQAVTCFLGRFLTPHPVNQDLSGDNSARVDQ